MAKINRDELVNTIFEILTFNDVLIQGAITSPIMSNIVFRELDIRIQKYCRKYELLNYLNGYRAFIISVMKYSENEDFLSKSKNKVERLENIVDEITK